MTGAVTKILDRLERPKQTRPGCWVAGCPVCQSRRGRPISVRDADDRVLIYAFCGCDTEQVLTALGLRLDDLFNRPLGHHSAPSRSRIPARDLLELVSYEADIVAIIAADFVEGRSISELAWQRLAEAARLIGAARCHLRG